VTVKFKKDDVEEYEFPLILSKKGDSQSIYSDNIEALSSYNFFDPLEMPGGHFNLKEEELIGLDYLYCS